MTSFQDATDESIEHDENMELRSIKPGFVPGYLYIALYHIPVRVIIPYHTVSFHHGIQPIIQKHRKSRSHR